MTSRYIIKDTSTEFINTQTGKDIEAYCNDCALPLVATIRDSIEKQKSKLTDTIKARISLIPILTQNSPNAWEYEPIGIVSAQSVGGTGFMSDLSASWNDLFGTQSNTMGNKVKQGEDICKDRLRLNCLNLGGNAIIATDIDYSEVGAGKGMLMVCMAGTAIQVNRWSSNFNEKVEDLVVLTDASRKLNSLNAIVFPDL